MRRSVYSPSKAGAANRSAARVVGAIPGAEIWLSEKAKEDIDQLGAARHKPLTWQRHEDVAMKGFPRKVTLWSLNSPPKSGPSDR